MRFEGIVNNLERRAERDRDIGGGEPPDWSVQILESVLRDESRDLGADPARPGRLMGDQRLARLANARQYAFAIERAERP